ncbi:MAG TPA: hypothetical protein VG755_29675, partial [Nannocystaceae bacterium]|nr:hypothetical protein [Nannocystaceae bacterium]
MSDAFVAGLERLLALLDDDVTTERDRIVIASALPITIAVDDAAIAAELGGWLKRFDRSGPDDEDAAVLALDLVAAALLGRARVVQHRRGDGTVVACEIAFASAR